MNVKKSLMVLSISLILLVSVSFVSAGFWDGLTGDATGTTDSASIRTTSIPPITVKEGKTAELSPDTTLTLGKVEGDTVTATVTGPTGTTKQVTLTEGNNFLPDGTTIKVADIDKGGLFTRDKATISIASPTDAVTGTEGGFDAGTTAGVDADLAGFAGGEVPSDAGEFFVGDNIVEVTSSGDGIYGLNIDERFSSNVLAGQKYAVPIPNLCFYWEVSVAIDGTATFEVKETGNPLCV